MLSSQAEALVSQLSTYIQEYFRTSYFWPLLPSLIGLLY